MRAQQVERTVRTELVRGNVSIPLGAPSGTGDGRRLTASERGDRDRQTDPFEDRDEQVARAKAGNERSTKGEAGSCDGTGARGPRDDPLVRLVNDALVLARRRERRFVAYLLEMALVELLDPTR